VLCAGHVALYFDLRFPLVNEFKLRHRITMRVYDIKRDMCLGGLRFMWLGARLYVSGTRVLTFFAQSDLVP
jgi:hypothetical protein